MKFDKILMIGFAEDYTRERERERERANRKSVWKINHHR